MSHLLTTSLGLENWAQVNTQGRNCQHANTHVRNVILSSDKISTYTCIFDNAEIW